MLGLPGLTLSVDPCGRRPFTESTAPGTAGTATLSCTRTFDPAWTVRTDPGAGLGACHTIEA